MGKEPPYHFFRNKMQPFVCGRSLEPLAVGN